jgi:hypothetical protein
MPPKKKVRKEKVDAAFTDGIAQESFKEWVGIYRSIYIDIYVCMYPETSRETFPPHFVK